eukprot:g8708.t1
MMECLRKARFSKWALVHTDLKTLTDRLWDFWHTSNVSTFFPASPFNVLAERKYAAVSKSMTAAMRASFLRETLREGDELEVNVDRMRVRTMLGAGDRARKKSLSSGEDEVEGQVEEGGGGFCARVSRWLEPWNVFAVKDDHVEQVGLRLREIRRSAEVAIAEEEALPKASTTTVQIPTVPDTGFFDLRRGDLLTVAGSQLGRNGIWARIADEEKAYGSKWREVYISFQDILVSFKWRNPDRLLAPRAPSQKRRWDSRLSRSQKVLLDIFTGRELTKKRASDVAAKKNVRFAGDKSVLSFDTAARAVGALTKAAATASEKARASSTSARPSAAEGAAADPQNDDPDATTSDEEDEEGQDSTHIAEKISISSFAPPLAAPTPPPVLKTSAEPPQEAIQPLGLGVDLRRSYVAYMTESQRQHDPFLDACPEGYVPGRLLHIRKRKTDEERVVLANCAGNNFGDLLWAVSPDEEEVQDDTKKTQTGGGEEGIQGREGTSSASEESDAGISVPAPRPKDFVPEPWKMNVRPIPSQQTSKIPGGSTTGLAHRGEDEEVGGGSAPEDPAPAEQDHSPLSNAKRHFAAAYDKIKWGLFADRHVPMPLLLRRDSAGDIDSGAGEVTTDGLQQLLASDQDQAAPAKKRLPRTAAVTPASGQLGFKAPASLATQTGGVADKKNKDRDNHLQKMEDVIPTYIRPTYIDIDELDPEGVEYLDPEPVQVQVMDAELADLILSEDDDGPPLDPMEELQLLGEQEASENVDEESLLLGHHVMPSKDGCRPDSHKAQGGKSSPQCAVPRCG